MLVHIDEAELELLQEAEVFLRMLTRLTGEALDAEVDDFREGMTVFADGIDKLCARIEEARDAADGT